MVATSCDLYAPRCATTVPQVRFTGPREVSSLVTDSLGTPVTPCFIERREERNRKKEMFYIYLDVTHTHW